MMGLRGGRAWGDGGRVWCGLVRMRQGEGERGGLEEVKVAPAGAVELLAEEGAGHVVEGVDEELVGEEAVDDALVEDVVVLAEVALLDARVRRRGCEDGRRAGDEELLRGRGRGDLEDEGDDDLAGLAGGEAEEEGAGGRVRERVLGLLARDEAREEQRRLGVPEARDLRELGGGARDPRARALGPRELAHARVVDELEVRGRQAPRREARAPGHRARRQHRQEQRRQLRLHLFRPPALG